MVNHLKGGINCRGEDVHSANVPRLEAVLSGVRVHGSFTTREDKVQVLWKHTGSTVDLRLEGGHADEGRTGREGGGRGGGRGGGERIDH